MGVSVELSELTAAGGLMGGRAAAYAGTSWTRLEPVDECGSAVVAAAFADMGAWLGMSWASAGEDVIALSTGLVTAASAYAAAEGVVGEAFGGSGATGTATSGLHAFAV